MQNTDIKRRNWGIDQLLIRTLKVFDIGEFARGARAPVLPPSPRQALIGWLISAGEPPALDTTGLLD